MRRFRVGKPFDVQIEEEDRQTAGHYDNVVGKVFTFVPR
jgi:hypothetical protein